MQESGQVGEGNPLAFVQNFVNFVQAAHNPDYNRR
jgi:hypothetical protein